MYAIQISEDVYSNVQLFFEKLKINYQKNTPTWFGEFCC
jgi:hypothetical protein